MYFCIDCFMVFLVMIAFIVNCHEWGFGLGEGGLLGENCIYELHGEHFIYI